MLTYGDIMAPEVIKMKLHSFFAWGTVFFFVMTMITGYERK